MGLESAASEKLGRQLQKVEKKRWYIQVLAAVQIFFGPPLMLWVLHVTANTQRSALAASLAGIGLMISLGGALGVYAVTMRRVQALVIFTSFEIFLTMLGACAAAVLLLLHHIDCWEPAATVSAAADATRQPWARCPNVVWLLVASAAVVLFLAATASEALSLRLRIQKTGKRNLNWNQKSQQRLERNVRRGASAALRALAPQLKDGDSKLEEDSRLKFLATHDKRYIAKSLLLLFQTLESGENKRLLLNLRKGYIKHGGLLGTKIYLSQVQEILLDEDDNAGGDDPTEARKKNASRSRAFASLLGRCLGCLRCIFTGGASKPAADAAEMVESGNADTLYSCIVHAHRTTGFGLSLFGLSSRSHTTVLDFRRPDERKRFLTYVVALLPPSIRVVHASGGIHGYGLERLGLLHSGGGGGSSALSSGARKGRRAFGDEWASSPAQQQPPQPQQQTPPHDRGDGNTTTTTPAPTQLSSSSPSPMPMLELSSQSPPMPPRHKFAPPASAGGAPAAAASSRSLGLSRGAASASEQSEMLSIFVGTWNMGDANPPAQLDGWISKEGQHDLYAIGVQECEQAENWLLSIDTHLGPSYVRIAERRMGGISLIVLTHRRHATKITGVETSFTPTGVLGVGTNKGAVALAFAVRGVRICVVNAHLAANQDALLQRNQQLQQIAKHLRLGTTALELPVQFHTFWCGDLNYRIDEERSEVLRLIENEQWHALYSRDQLANELAAEHILFGFGEVPPTFPPTYKYARLAGPGRRRPFGKIRLGKSSSPSKWGAGGGAAADKFDATAADGSGGGGSPETRRRSSDQLKSQRDSGASGMSPPPGGGLVAGGQGLAAAGGGAWARKYDEEKIRVPSWCDRVLWRALPGGAVSVIPSGSADSDDPHFYASDHAPVSTTFEVELPVLPSYLPLHHCTIYLSNLTLYRARPRPNLTGPTAAASAAYSAPQCSARTAQGKGVPLPVAGAKLQNLPPQLTVHAHMLVLHRLMAEPPHHAAALHADGKSSTNIVIGPMLAQKEYLALQQLQLRVVSISGGRPTELGQAAFSLEAAANGRPLDFDVIVEKYTVPAGFNLKGTLSIVYTKTLGDEHWQEYASARQGGMPPSSFHRGHTAVRSRGKPSSSVLRASQDGTPGVDETQAV